MARTQPKTRLSKVMEILLGLAGLGVLTENIFRFQLRRCGHRWPRPGERDDFPIRVSDVRFSPAKKQ